MESRFKLLGHPVHPMLIVFPLGLFSTAVIFDLLYVTTANEEFAIVSFWAIAVGVIGGLAAGVFGVWDYLAIPGGTRARAVGMWHGGGNLVVIGLFGLSWLVRRDDPTYLPEILPLLLALAGAAISLVTAWLGGELVYRLRVGVDDGANLDASHSLRGGVAEVERPT